MNSVAIPEGVAGYRLAVVGQDAAVDSASVRSSAAAAADEGDGSKSGMDG